MHLKDLLDTVSDSLFKYGGHAEAAGISVEKAKLDSIRKTLQSNCIEPLGYVKDDTIYYDLEIDVEDLPKVLEELEKLVKAHEGLYCEGCGSRYGLHAQVGIDSDGRENSPGTRIAVGNEPIMPLHIAHSAKYHKFFPTGTGDIFKFEETWENTPDAVVDVIKGAMNMGMRYFSGYLENNDVVRVTGYLVKKSELAKLDANGQSINNASIFGKGARDFSNALDRRVHESNNK